MFNFSFTDFHDFLQWTAMEYMYGLFIWLPLH